MPPVSKTTVASSSTCTRSEGSSEKTLTLVSMTVKPRVVPFSPTTAVTTRLPAVLRTSTPRPTGYARSFKVSAPPLRLTLCCSCTRSSGSNKGFTKARSWSFEWAGCNKFIFDYDTESLCRRFCFENGFECCKARLQNTSVFLK